MKPKQKKIEIKTNLVRKLKSKPIDNLKKMNPFTWRDLAFFLIGAITVFIL